MGVEANFSKETPRHERFLLRNMPFDVSNRFQAQLAAEAYVKHCAIDAEAIPSSKAMLRWITQGYAREYGDYIVASDLEIDVNNRLDREEVLEELEKRITMH